MAGVSGTARSVLERRGADLLAIALVFLAYTVTLWVAHGQNLGASLTGGAANTVPVVVFGAVARHLILTRLAGRGLVVQAAGHVVLCAGFSLLSFWLLIVLLGLINGASPTEFSVRAFPAGGTAWQLLEEATTYAVLAALTYAQLGRPPPIAPAPPAEAAPKAAGPVRAEPPRYFTRAGEDLRPIDLERVVCIGGADDYAEVTTLDGALLVRMTLSEFEQTLDPARFARVHRSWIVNLDRVERAEPAGGGRMLLHMQTGQAIPASRSGARSLRDRVI
jgi:two-component system, LytTR family, response regulator